MNTDSPAVKTRKKLIEVALPLEAINEASAREKSIRHGHPSTMHLWWARRPLAAARAVIFSQMVDDPSEYVDELLANPETRAAGAVDLAKRRALWNELKTKHEATSDGSGAAPGPGPEPTLEDCAADIERERLFVIIRELVRWENTTNEAVLQQARDEIWRSWRCTCTDNVNHPRASELFDPDKLPGFHDPFAGGGSLPLEAQRLGLEAYASDLNPVAVLINKAMIEIPPKFASRPPVNPESRAEKQLLTREWRGTQGLAEDVRYYGTWMRHEAEKRIGHLYPKVGVTVEMAAERPDLKPLIGQKLTVIAWLWARTVKSPNPAFASVDVPLASSFLLYAKPGKEAYVEPLVDAEGYRFIVKVGKPKHPEATKNGTKLAGANFVCLMSGAPISGEYIKVEGKAGRMGARLMAVVAEGERGRVYMPPTEEMEAVARHAMPEWKPEVEFFQQALGFRVGGYGMTKWSDLFTPRQTVALTMFSDLVGEAREQVKRDALASGWSEDCLSLSTGGTGALAYADAAAVYLAMGVNRTVHSVCTLVRWNNARGQSNVVFARQALSMLWDYADVNPFAGAAGDLRVSCEGVASGLSASTTSRQQGHALQLDASTQLMSAARVVSTDPPYYDNVGYADLSDFFYVWLRHSLRPVLPDLFATMTVPKVEELVATPERHGGKPAAEAFFLNGMTKAMQRLAPQAHPAFPVTIYYAFKQSESDGVDGTVSTGWESFLDAVIRAGFTVTGTLPMRTERAGRMRDTDSNALASSIVLVCRRRPENAPTATRGEFVAALKAELPTALTHLQRGNIAPVDLAQAAIGPGMAVFTRYARVLDARGEPLSVGQALALINHTLDEVLAEQEGDFDADSRWALAWFEQQGFAEGEYGVAETLSKAKNTSLGGLVEAHIVASKGGKVRLLRPSELPENWNPEADPRLTAWEVVHHLVRALESGGESAAAALVGKLGAKAEIARELCYRLYVLCDRKKRSAEALSYNALVLSWPEISRLAREAGTASAAQGTMFAEVGA